MSRPFIKWVGGKRQLIDTIKAYMPHQYNRYFEPFIGGGALFFELKPNNAFINDCNVELINLYSIVKNHPNELLEELEKHINNKEYYYEIRNLDRDLEQYQNLSDIQRASRFIYLNKTAYNGLYRVNKNGFFNVPFGQYKNPNYIDHENILSCSKLLQQTTILNDDFEVIKPYIGSGDFVYFDPPYVPLSKTSSFTEYTKDGFDEIMQVRLRYFCDYIHSIGAYFMVSNSFTPYIKELYKNYTLLEVEANRSINSIGSNRGKINEYLIVNYHPIRSGR